MYFKVCDSISPIMPDIGDLCNTMVDQIDEIIHMIVDDGFSPTHICCLGEFLCAPKECRDKNTHSK